MCLALTDATEQLHQSSKELKCLLNGVSTLILKSGKVFIGVTDPQLQHLRIPV